MGFGAVDLDRRGIWGGSRRMKEGLVGSIWVTTEGVERGLDAETALATAPLGGGLLGGGEGEGDCCGSPAMATTEGRREDLREGEAAVGEKGMEISPSSGKGQRMEDGGVDGRSLFLIFFLGVVVGSCSPWWEAQGEGYGEGREIPLGKGFGGEGGTWALDGGAGAGAGGEEGKEMRRVEEEGWWLQAVRADTGSTEGRKRVVHRSKMGPVGYSLVEDEDGLVVGYVPKEMLLLS